MSRRRFPCLSSLCAGRRRPQRCHLVGRAPFDRECNRGMVESASLKALRTAAAKRRKRQKAEDREAEDREAELHIGHRLAEEGIGPGQAGHIVADAEPVVDTLEEDSRAAVIDHKHPAVADILVGDIGLGVVVGHSPVVEGRESDSELDIAPGELPGNLAEKNLQCG